MKLHDDFAYGWSERWQVTQQGGGEVTRRMKALHLALPPSTQAKPPYANAQITDYDPAQRNFAWRPPLHLRLNAFFGQPAEQMVGTAGFGFWNFSYGIGAKGLLLPQALWFFFCAPPSDMPLALNVPGTGWKAATFDARNWRFLALAPIAPLAFLLMRLRPARNLLWPIGQRAIGVHEALLDPETMVQEATYELEWLPQRAIFRVNGQVVQDIPVNIRQPLGFIAWIDNRWAVVTPWGHFAFGTTAPPHNQILVLSHVSIENM
ncbi:MAG: hypothetical protein NZ750_14215 [Anaerolineae bacterium]|nr:hypothetical protein [Anaerolineae bacterium]MDW8173757.1 hypothetical protein [Anaerolineae bacterium]